MTVQVACERGRTGMSQWYGCGNRQKWILLKNGRVSRIILKRMLNEYDCTAWTGFIWLRTGAFVNALMNFESP